MRLGIVLFLACISAIVTFVVFAVMFTSPIETSSRWYWASLLWFVISAPSAAAVSPDKKWLSMLVVYSPILLLISVITPGNQNQEFLLKIALPLILVLLVSALIVARFKTEQNSDGNAEKPPGVDRES